MNMKFLMPAAGLALTGLAFLAAPAGPQSGSAAVKFTHEIPNIPGKSVTSVEVTLPPGGKSHPHHHASSAFIYGYVLSGAIRTQVEGGPVQTLKAGESFFELPGAHHILGENVSDTEPAKFLAVFVVDTNDKTLTTPDK
jgi:quercetin dioxygenase-like cupin family protein